MAEKKMVLLRTGENIICSYIENSDGSSTFIDALAFQLAPTAEDPSKPGLVFGMAFPFAKDPANVTLPKEMILYAMDPNDQIADAHQARTSKLIIPKLR